MTTELEPQTTVDVSLTEEEKAARKTEAVNPRDEMMKRIAEKRAQQVAEESGFSGVDVAQINEPAEEEQVEIVPVVEEEPVAPTSAPEQQVPTQEEKPVEQEKVILTVNGQKLEVTKEELISMAQKGIGAEQKFQEAARLRQEAAAAMQNLQHQPQTAHPQQQDDSSKAPETDKNVLREIAHKITYGSEEESEKAIQDLVGLTVKQVQGRQQGPSPEQIAQAATQNALAHIQFERSLERLNSEYPDIFESRARTVVAADKVISLRAAYQQMGIAKSEFDLYKEACQATRSEFAIENKEPAKQEETPSQPTVQAATNQQKLERKRAAPSSVSAASKVMQMQEQKSYQTGSDIVANMRKARGQASY